MSLMLKRFFFSLYFPLEALLMVGMLASGCDQDNKKTETVNQAKHDSAETGSPGTGFSEMAMSVIKQAAGQGLQIETSQAELLARLIRIYLVRGDLHQAFGNPEKFNLTGLIQWAADAGVTVDYDKPKLAPYAGALTALARKTNADKPVYVRLE